MGLVLVRGSIHWCRLISSEVMYVGVQGGLSLGSFSEPNRPDQPVNLSPVLLDEGPIQELISLGTLGNLDMTPQPASCGNKIWESWWWVEVTCPLSLHSSQMPGPPAGPIRLLCSHPGQTVERDSVATQSWTLNPLRFNSFLLHHMSYQPVPLPVHVCQLERLANIYTPVSPPVSPVHTSHCFQQSPHGLSVPSFMAIYIQQWLRYFSLECSTYWLIKSNDYFYNL